METIDILLTIKNSYNILTKNEKSIADTILKDPQKVLRYSITELADCCKVSIATVFRFCKDLNLKGYQDFKLALAKSISAQESDETSSLESTGNVSVKQDLLHDILCISRNATTDTYRQIDSAALKEAVFWMKGAEKIVFAGVGASLITCLEAKNKFMRITGKSDTSLDAHFLSMMASLLTPKDVLIAFSDSGASKDTVDIAKIAKSRGAKVIAVTRFQKSPLAEYSDLIFLCGSNEGPLQGGSMAAKFSQLFILEALYQEYFRQTYDSSKANKTATADAVSDKLY